MAKFAGFTPDQQFILLQKQGYQGPADAKEMDKFLQATPSAAAALGKWVEVAQKRLNDKPNAIGMAEGGLVAENSYKTMEDWNENANLSADDKANVAAHNPTRQGFATPAAAEDVNVTADQFINSNDQALKQNTNTAVTADTVQNVATSTTPTRKEAEQVDPTLVSDKVTETLNNTQAAKADPTAKATVKGQLETLMSDFEGGATPPWASGAMRAATALMQQRGLGASSVAGQAVVQAAMEAATAIASTDAQINAQFELKNLDNEQQTTIFKAQQQISALFTDQAQENATKQFNASSKQQVDQFYSQLEQTASQFNAAQINAINQFNAGQTNAMKQFNKQVEAQRDQFNATQSLVIAQANVKWRQDISLTNQKAQNEANMEFARQANGLTQQALDAIWQKERDEMAFAFQSSQNEQDRAVQLYLGNKQVNSQNAATKASASGDRMQAIGYVAAKIIGNMF